MDPSEQSRVSASDSETRNGAEAIREGNAVLQRLSSQLEHQQTQLSKLLDRAAAGETEALVKWLNDFKTRASPSSEDAAVGGTTGGRRQGARSGAESAQAVQERSEPKPDFSWDDILHHARNRLNEIYTHSEVHRRVGGVQKASKATSANVTNEKNDAEQMSAPALAEIAQSVAKKDSQIASDTLLEKLGIRSSVWGVVASILLHLVLVAVLAIVTLKLPAAPAGLAFDASDASEVSEVVELEQPLEATVPEASPSESVPVELPTVSEQLATVGPAVLDVGDLESSLAAASSASRVSQAMSAVSAVAASSKASFFGAAASGNCFCYIIDGSSSMRGGPWEAAKFELLKSLSSLDDNQRFYIIFFNRQLSAIPLPGEREPAPHAMYATKENLEHARRWVDTLKINVGAAPTKALELGISKEPDAIYLLTDGVTKVDVPKMLREENRVTDLINGEQVRVPIHSIAFYSLKGQALLRRISSENRGQFIYVPDPRKK